MCRSDQYKPLHHSPRSQNRALTVIYARFYTAVNKSDFFAFFLYLDQK